MLSSYQFAGNTPIWAIDFEGLEPLYSQELQRVNKIIKTRIEKARAEQVEKQARRPNVAPLVGAKIAEEATKKVGGRMLFMGAPALTGAGIVMLIPEDTDPKTIGGRPLWEIFSSNGVVKIKSDPKDYTDDELEIIAKELISGTNDPNAWLAYPEVIRRNEALLESVKKHTDPWKEKYKEAELEIDVLEMALKTNDYPSVDVPYTKPSDITNRIKDLNNNMDFYESMIDQFETYGSDFRDQIKGVKKARREKWREQQREWQKKNNK